MPQVVRFRSSYQESYPLKVEGESYHRQNIEQVSGYLGEEDGVKIDDLIAQLVLEDTNQSDPGNAVKVEIDGLLVGHLSREVAARYRMKLKQLGIPGATGECYASVRGGYIKRSTGEQADFGVRLDLIIDELEILPETPQPAQIQPKAEIPVKVQPISKVIEEDQPFWSRIWKRIKKLFTWSIAKGRWWKTLLFLFFGLPCLCGVGFGLIQKIIELIFK